MANNLFATETKRVDSAPVLCCVTEDSGLALDISVTCSVMLVYDTSEQADCAAGSGMKAEDLTRFLENNYQREINSTLLTAFAKLTEGGISYRNLQLSESTIAEFLNDRLYDSWLDLYGVKITNIAVSNIRASAEDEKKLAAFATPSSNPLGAGNLPNDSLPLGDAGMKARYFEGTVLDSILTQASTWTCHRCGAESTGKFCPSCGSPRG